MWSNFLQALATGADPVYTLDMAQRDLRHVEDASGGYFTSVSLTSKTSVACGGMSGWPGAEFPRAP